MLRFAFALAFAFWLPAGLAGAATFNIDSTPGAGDSTELTLALAVE